MLSIRQARPDEYDAVGALLSASYGEYGPEPDDPADLIAEWEAYHRDIPDVRSRLADAELVVAELDGAIVGTVTYYPPRDTPLPERWPAGYGALRLLGVHPSGRGAGVGRALTVWCIEQSRARGATHVGLHTTHLMTVAREMYERMGFIRVPAYDFVLPNDFVVMAYELKL